MDPETGRVSFVQNATAATTILRGGVAVHIEGTAGAVGGRARSPGPKQETSKTMAGGMSRNDYL